MLLLERQLDELQGHRNKKGDKLERFVLSSPECRQMMHPDLSLNFPKWNVGQEAICNALKRREYSRFIAWNKPKLSNENWMLRLE